ncbi:guanine nucleotide-binding protein subunit beta-like protein 1 isoform X2 [Xylocopa sonorina]|uniref:guanine nucleotide-binding protein subunit beta-like protein 1 isoform X2 n=1 Tax=Xylocopa sonorina TaxID=1818115 RepID=UPI00403AB562
MRTNRELDRIASGQDSCLSLLSLNIDHLLAQHKCGLINMYKKTESQWIVHKSVNIDFYHYCRIQRLSESEVIVPLKESTIGILSANTFNVELKLSTSNLKNLGEVMVIKPLQNERLVLVGYEGGKLILWDVRQSKILNSLTVESNPMALEFDPTLRKGAIAGPSDNIQIFTLSVDHLLCDKSKITLTNPGTSVITIRPDGRVVAIGGWDSRVRIFSWKSLKPLAVLDQHKEAVQDINYSTRQISAYDNKNIMATAAKDGYIALWDIYN